MTKERPTESGLEQEARNYLQKNYPVRKIDVKEILEQLESEGESVPLWSVAERHINLAISFASQSGLDHKPKGRYPEVLYVPAILTAVMEFEKKHKADLQQQLPLSRYLGILAIGEMATIRNNSRQGWRFSETQIH